MKTLTKNKNKKFKYSFKANWNGVPATVRQTLFEATLYESFFTSLVWHIIGVLLIWAITFSIMFFGLAPKLFPTPKTKIKDIEFVIKGQSTHRSRHSKAKSVQPSNETVSTPKPEQNKINSNITPQKNNDGKKNAVIPDFSMPMPNLKSLSSGLGGSAKTSSSSTSGTSNSPISDINNAFSTSKGSSGSSAGFDKNTTKKMITTYDISPYVNELKRNIKWNWKIPKGNENKRVDLFLRIAKDGRLIILNVKRTSEIGEVDNAALSAVKKCLPLSPLPAKYNKSYLDIIFTFGSNSIGSRY